MVFAAAHPGTSPQTPYLGGYKPGEVEPVEVEETVTRRVRPTGLPFEVPVKVDARYVIDVHPSFAKEIEGLGPVIEAFEAHYAEVEGVPYPGSGHAWGRCYLQGKVVAGAMDDLPDGWLNALVADKDAGGNPPKRAVAALPLPDSFLHLTARRGGRSNAATLVVCFGDARRVPDSLSEALAGLGAESGPRP